MGFLLLETAKAISILENVVKKHLKERFLRRQAAQRDESEQIVIGQSHLYRVNCTLSLHHWYKKIIRKHLVFV